MKEYLTLCLTSMSQDGRAVGRIERQQPYQGMAVFVENALAGQTVKAEILSKKRISLLPGLLKFLSNRPLQQREFACTGRNAGAVHGKI